MATPGPIGAPLPPTLCRFQLLLLLPGLFSTGTDGRTDGSLVYVWFKTVWIEARWRSGTQMGTEGGKDLFDQTDCTCHIVQVYDAFKVQRQHLGPRQSPLLRSLTPVMLRTVTGAGLLPPPQDVFVDSVNMKHLLRWRPPESSCSIFSYSVQFQGEFELQILNGSWEEVHMCQRIRTHVCDLSAHLSSDSDYVLRVQAECDGNTSHWEHLAKPFNRKQTQLAPPTISIHTVGTSALVNLPDLPPPLELFLVHWQRGDEGQASIVELSPEQRMFHLSKLQEGVTYCLRAHVHLHGSNRSVASETHCFSITDLRQPRPKVAALCVSALVILALLCALLWYMTRFCRTLVHSFCPEETLPDALECVKHHAILGLKVHPQEEREAYLSVLLLDPAHLQRRGDSYLVENSCQCLMVEGGGASLAAG
ncbi:interleukin-20 receptor subunit beta [Arapaima gigas]